VSANVKKSNEQMMSRFLNGLNHPIMRIMDFQPYNNLLELVHQATKVGRQVQEDIKYSKFSTFLSRNFTSNPRATSSVVPYPQATPPSGVPSSSKASMNTSSRAPTSSYMPRATPSTNPTRDSTDKSSQFECFTCKGHSTNPLSAPQSALW
jgi:hypothetical protein